MESYVIERDIRFEPAESRLTQLTTQESVVLSLLSGKLLELLLSRHGYVVSREDIFVLVFDKYNASSSNNNLNQNISTLRKHFLSLQLEAEVIQTVPKIGFLIPKSIEIGKTPLPVSPVKSLPFAELAEDKPHKTDKWLTTRKTIIFSLVWLFLLGLLYVYQVKTVATVEWIPKTIFHPRNVSDSLRCKIYNLATNRSFSTDVLPEYVLKECDDGKYTFYIAENPISQNKSRLFILKCLAVSETTCTSIYQSVER